MNAEGWSPVENCMNSTCPHDPGDTHAALTQGRRTFIVACRQLLLWILCLTLLALPARAEAPDIPWRAHLSKKLAELGQRNWIVQAIGQRQLSKD